MEKETGRHSHNELVESDRADERGDAAEPNAPFDAEENEGMSTVLTGDQGDGVQDNAGER